MLGADARSTLSDRVRRRRMSAWGPGCVKTWPHRSSAQGRRALARRPSEGTSTLSDWPFSPWQVRQSPMRSWNVSARQGTAIACTNVRAISNVRMSLCSGWSRRGFGWTQKKSSAAAAPSIAKLGFEFNVRRCCCK